MCLACIKQTCHSVTILIKQNVEVVLVFLFQISSTSFLLCLSSNFSGKPVDQFYKLTQLRLSNVRSNDEL